MPSMAEMSDMIDKLGGPGKLQEAAKNVDTETTRQMAEITKQV